MIELPDHGVEFSYQIASANIDGINGYGATYEVDYNSSSFNTTNNNKKISIESWIRYDEYDKDFNIDHIGYLYRNNLKNYNLGLSINFLDNKYFSQSNLSVNYIKSKNFNNVVLENMISFD